MSSMPWSNETERADYSKKLFEEQLAICDRLEAENRALIVSVKHLGGHLSSSRDEAFNEFAEELKQILVINSESNTKFFDFDNILKTIDWVLSERTYRYGENFGYRK